MCNIFRLFSAPIVSCFQENGSKPTDLKLAERWKL